MQYLKRNNHIINVIQTTAGRTLFSILPILYSIKESSLNMTNLLGLLYCGEYNLQLVFKQKKNQIKQIFELKHEKL